jgi:hypothetical protein
MYYGAENIFEMLEDIAYADEEAYYSGEGSRELTDASARLQQYSDDFNQIGSIIEDLEYEMTETASSRQLGYLEEEIEYYQYTREEIEALEWNTEDLISGLNEAADEAGDLFAEQDDEDYEFYFELQEEYESEFDYVDSIYNDLYYRAYALYGQEEYYDEMEELWEEADEWMYDYWYEASDDLWFATEELAPIIERREARSAGENEAAAALDALELEEERREEYNEVLDNYSEYYEIYYEEFYATEDYAVEEELSAELLVYSREMDKFFRDLETQEAERARADNLAYRRETTEWMDADMEDAMNIKDYYMTVIRNNEEKLSFFDLVYNSYEDDEYGWDMKENLDWHIQYTYDQFVNFQKQMGEIDTYISNLNFDRFMIEQQWQQEDEAMYQDIIWRAEAQEQDYLFELNEIEEAIGESYELEGDRLDAWITAYGSVEYGEYNNRKADLNEWLEAVEREIIEFTEIAGEFAEGRAAEEAARVLAAAQEELNKAASDRDAEEKRIKRERENAN